MRAKLYSLSLSFLLLTLVSLQVRQAEAQVHTSTPGPPSNIARPDSIQFSGLYDYWTMMSGQGRAGGVLLGKLAMEGEPLPWQPLLISVDCNGSIVNSTQTDLQGRFVITFAETHGTPGTPSDAQRQMETKYEGCKVRGTVAGFRSSVATITVHNLRDEPNLGTITLSPEGREGGTEISTTTQAAPSNAMKAFEKARSDFLAQNNDGAEKNLKKAVQIYPGFAQAWLQLGELQKSSDSQAARDSFSKAMAADPKFILPYEQLAELARDAQDWKAVLDQTSKALDLDPTGTPQLWYEDALAKFQLGKTDEAKVSIEKGLAMDHQQPSAEQLLAVILARKADYAGAVQHLKNSLTYLPPGPQADMVKQQIAQLETKLPAAK
jgi:Tfp pilus assembly protein PilF